MRRSSAAFIIQNNIRVALICFAGGMLLGIPTAFVLLTNGWMLGTVAAAVRLGGYDFQFWSLIVPHGVLELSVIVISGGTGLMLGDAILRPGQLRRGEALARVAVRAVLLALGAASLLIIAGTLEAFVSPSSLPDGVKLAVGASVGVLLYSWLLLAGRTPRRPARALASTVPRKPPRRLESMDVVRITPRGYCHGVVEAIRIAKREGAARAGSEPVTMLGYLVHNEHVTRELEESGVALVAEPDRMKALEQVTEGTVIFTAHGISPAVVDAARARGLNLVDATCSDVTRTHDLVRELVASGHHVIYIGKRGHPEPAGVLGIAPEHTTLIESIEEAARRRAARRSAARGHVPDHAEHVGHAGDHRAPREALSDHRGPQRDLPRDPGAAGGGRARGRRRRLRRRGRAASAAATASGSCRWFARRATGPRTSSTLPQTSTLHGSAAFTVSVSPPARRRRRRSLAQSSPPWRRCPTPRKVTFRLQRSQTRKPASVGRLR